MHPAPTEISPLSLHDALPICRHAQQQTAAEHGHRREPRETTIAAQTAQHMQRERDRNAQTGCTHLDRKSTRLNSSHMSISYAVFCLKKKKNKRHKTTSTNKLH